MATYWDNIRELRKRPNQETFNLCLDFWNSGESKKQMIAIDVLAQLGITSVRGPKVKKYLKIFFDTLDCYSDLKVLDSTLYAIGHNNEFLKERDIERLNKFTQHPNSDIRKSLTFCLCGVDYPLAIKILIELSRDRFSDIRSWATFGIGTQIETDTPEIRQALWDRVTDKHEETRFEAIKGLSVRKDEQVLEIIRREIEKGDFGSFLLESIIDWNLPEFIPPLKAIYEVEKTNESTSPTWIKDLKHCIEFLENPENKE